MQLACFEKKEERFVKKVVKQTRIIFSDGTRKDEWPEAIRQLKKAASTNHPDAAFELGVKYGIGLGTRRNYLLAFRWYRRALLRIHLTAFSNLAVIIDQLPSDLHLRIAKESLLANGAYEDDCDAIFKLAEHLYFDPYEEEDRPVAAFWYNRASDLGHWEARYALAHMLQHGLGIDADSVEAIRMFRQLARSGHVASMYQLAAAYYTGEGVKKNERTSNAWLKHSAALGYPNAVRELRELKQSNRERADSIAKEQIGSKT